MKKHALLSALALVALSGCGKGGSAEATGSGREAWVTVDRLHRRTCPDERCGSVGTLFFRDKATIYEESMGWARISKVYDASCKGGRSEYVDAGNAKCEPSNGIVNGQFAEWVSLQYLSAERPADPAAGATGDFALVSGSDDYQTYKNVFAKAATDLIASGRCTRTDFVEMGGWIKSANHRTEPIYFTYCGGMRIENRLYLDASTGRVFR
jgi:hypothetical protein